MEANVKEIKINGIDYVPKEQTMQLAQIFEGMKYVICRTYSAGVFAGYLEKLEGKKAVLRNARRLWKWVGAASLSQLAMTGPSKPKECMFPCEVDRVEFTEAIEIIDCTEEARLAIKRVEIWKA
jgi:hypothetical protein